MLDRTNQLEHRIAEAEYGEEGGVDALDCFHNQGKWRLEWREQRIPSMTMDALDHIQLESLAAGAAGSADHVLGSGSRLLAHSSGTSAHSGTMPGSTAV